MSWRTENKFEEVTRRTDNDMAKISVRHGIVCSSCYSFKLILCSPWHCLFFLLPLQTYSLFSMALFVLLVTPSNLFSVLHGIVCSSCYPFKLILCSPWHCLFFLLPLQTYSLFSMTLYVLLVTPSNLFSVLHGIVCSSCYPFTLILCSPWHCLLENKFEGVTRRTDNAMANRE
jgi:hypothetical protein